MVSVEIIVQQASDSIIAEKVAEAVRRLFELDAYLLRVDANERAITHRLALHLTPLFPDWDVDCEYNRSGDLSKRVGPCEESTNGSRIFPDIIIHHRGQKKNNLLVIEVKKSTSTKGDEDDISKLRLLREQLEYTYAYALFLRFGYHKARPTVEVKWV